MKLNRLPLILAVFLAGCDGDAIEFARRTRALLDEYQKKIDIQISAAAKYYMADADIGNSEARRQMNSTVAVDRDERATELAADYLERRKTPSLYRNELRAYARSEYDTRSASYRASIDASLPYVRQLARLEADKETIEGLRKALEALEKKRNILAEAKGSAGLAAETRKDFSLLVCTDLKNQQAKLTGEAAAATGSQQTDLQAQTQAVAQLRTDRKCDDLEKAAASAPVSAPVSAP